MGVHWTIGFPAQPLMTFSVFDDYAREKKLTLVRADILNAGIDAGEGLKVVKSMLDNYKDDAKFLVVKAFNKKPDSFDIDDYITQQNVKWNSGDVGNVTIDKTVDVER